MTLKADRPADEDPVRRCGAPVREAGGRMHSDEGCTRVERRLLALLLGRPVDGPLTSSGTGRPPRPLPTRTASGLLSGFYLVVGGLLLVAGAAVRLPASWPWALLWILLSSCLLARAAVLGWDSDARTPSRWHDVSPGRRRLLFGLVWAAVALALGVTALAAGGVPGGG